MDCRLIEEGADLIDVGGESTRPGADRSPAEEELRRVMPVVEGLAAAGVLVSIDTSKASVARPLHRGRGGSHQRCDRPRRSGDGSGRERAEAGLVLMHMQGNPRTMQPNPTYDDVVGEVSGF